MSIELKHPAHLYAPRLSRFLVLMDKVRALTPPDLHLWKVMDSVAFEDTETALETTLFNQKTSRKDDKRA